ncbi:MAG TPA: OsmC family protein [Steroidobacteraceae bacterium]|jgi:uncharacterized OsmC-like protein|nr:OsmC family protein [Steroidobacteraceae bacterium]
MSNLQARDALERAQRVFLEKPAAARKAGAIATAVWRNGLFCEITGPTSERAMTDMPEPMGGNGSGPSPGWLLRAGMASCAATSIAMRAAMLGIELRQLEVSVKSESDARGLVGIPNAPTAFGDMRMSIRIGADGVEESQLRELAMWAGDHSPVSCTLRDSPPVTLDISVV